MSLPTVFYDKKASERLLLDCDCFYFGLDTVVFTFPKGFEGTVFRSLFFGLSMNSPENNQLSFSGIPLKAVYHETGSRRILQLKYLEDAVMCIDEILGTDVTAKYRSWVVTFYSAYFYLPGIEKILMDFCYEYNGKCVVSRCDLCLDVSASVDDLYNHHVTRFSKQQRYQKNGQIETFYLGSKQGNKDHFIRVYNKKLDSKKKGKFHLFLDYLALPCVSRVELQMNSRSCRKYDVTVLDILECFGEPQERRGGCRLHEHVFRNLVFNMQLTCFMIAMMPKKNEKFSFLDHQQSEVLDELQYARQMLGYAKRLQELGFDVVSYLTAKLDL